MLMEGPRRHVLLWIPDVAASGCEKFAFPELFFIFNVFKKKPKLALDGDTMIKS